MVKESNKGTEDWYKKAVYGDERPEPKRKIIPRNPRKPDWTRKSLRQEEREQVMGPCVNCGNDDLRVIQLHHPDRNARPLEVIPLCANCHTLYHYAIGRNRRAESTKKEVLDILKRLT